MRQGKRSSGWKGKKVGSGGPITNMGNTIKNNILHSAWCGSRHKHMLRTVTTNKPVTKHTNIWGRKVGFLCTCNRKKKGISNIKETMLKICKQYDERKGMDTSSHRTHLSFHPSHHLPCHHHLCLLLSHHLQLSSAM